MMDWVLAGNRDGAHGVIGSSMKGDLPFEIARRIDLPGSLPSELRSNILPSPGFFSIEDKFVFYETSLDKEASRSGMVRSGAFVVSSTDASEVDDPLEFIIQARAVRNGQPLSPSATETEPENPEACPRLLATLRGGRAVAPLNENAWTVVRSAWIALPRMMRHLLFVRLCFSSDDLPADRMIAIGFMPEAIRWACPENLWVETPLGEASADTNDLVTELAYGNGRRLDDFARLNGLSLGSFRDLDLVRRIMKLTAGSSANIDDLITGLRFAISIAARSDTLLTDLASRISDRLPDASVETIMAMRNLEVPPEHVEPIKTATGNWTVKALADPLRANIALSAFQETRNLRCKAWWRSAIAHGVSAYNGPVPKSFGEFVWRQGEKSLEDGKFWFDALSNNPDLDEQMARFIPSGIDASIYQLAEQVGVGKIPISYAQALLLCRDTNYIRDKISKISNSKAQYTATKHAFYNLSKKEKSIFIDTDSKGGFTDALDEIYTEDKSSFSSVETKNSAMQALICRYLSNNRKDIDKHVLQRIYDIFDLFIEGNYTDPELPPVLIANENINALTFARRADLWRALPTPLSIKIRERTAISWLENIELQDPGDIEPELKATLTDWKFRSRISSTSRNVDLKGWNALASLWRLIPYELKSELFNIINRSRSLDPDDVVRMSMVIQDVEDRGLAGDLVRRFNDRKDLKPAWPLIESMLPFYWKLYLPDVEFSTQDWDHALCEILSEMYPEGPEADGVWERAGGRDSDIASSKSGRKKWREAFRLIENGGRATRLGLINQALSDHPNSEKLKNLRRRIP